MSHLRLAFLGDAESPHLHRWLRAFVERGHAVAMLVPSSEVREVRLPAGVERLSFRGLPAGFSLPGVLATRRDLRRLLADWRPEVLHAHYARRPAWHAWLSGQRPYVVTAWGSDVLLSNAMTLPGRIATRLALRGAELVTVGTRQLAAAAAALGARRDRLREVQFGIDTQLFSPEPPRASLREELGLAGKRVVVSPRALLPLYRHDVVVRALASLPRDVVVVSSAMRADEAERAGLEALAARLGVADRWRILPAMDAAGMADLYRLADVLVSVPESDAMPQSVMEAMATGTPAVVSDLRDARDWLADLTPELFVPVGDADATAAALATALSQPPGARGALGERLRARIVERAEAQSNMDLVEGWYRELAEGRSA